MAKLGFPRIWLCAASLVISSAACRDHQRGGTLEPEPDGGHEGDGGGDADTSVPPVDGPPRLERPGQVVPLLYGRVVEVTDQRAGASGTAYVPLDDPGDPSHHALFSDLSAACRAEVSAELTPPGAGTSIPGCGREGVFEALVTLCRGRAALAFSVPSSGAGIANGPQGPALALDGAAGTRLWTMDSSNTSTAASWAMFAVAEQREAVAVLARALDPMACASGLGEASTSGGVSLAMVAAEGLGAAVQVLPGSTARADELLKQHLEELIEAQGALDAAGRERFARALNDSQLERMKLFAAVPYGAFIPVAGELAEVPAERYPLLPESEPLTAQASVLLAAVHADAVTEARVARSGDELLARWYAAVRAAEPLAFGSLGDDEASAALARFEISQDMLDRAAQQAAATLRASGAPLAARPLDGGKLLDGLSWPDASAPAGYPATLTEAAATLDEDEADYARRGMAHALELAARAAQRAIMRDDAQEARNALSALAEKRGHAHACLASGEDGLSLHIELVDVRAADLSSYRLVRGEDATSCALTGLLAGVPCVPDAAQPAGEAGVFDVGRATDAADTLYLLGPSDGAPAVLAAFSLAPFGMPESERCTDVPLSAAQHASLSRLHGELLAPPLGLAPTLPVGEAPFTLADDMPVPLAFDRTLGVSRGEESISLAVSPAFATTHLELERALLTSCASEPYKGTDPEGQSCAATALLGLHRLRCVGDGIAALADAQGGSAGPFVLALATPVERVSLSLWAFELRRRELAELATAIEGFECTPAETGSEGDLEGKLWARLDAVRLELESRYVELRDALDGERSGASSDLDEAARLVHQVRGFSGSALAAARLVLAVPFSLHEPVDGEADPLDQATVRFPVVARSAHTAEDTRIEGLLRSAGIHPLAPDLTLADGVISAEMLQNSLNSEITLRLRERLVALNPEKYQDSPENAGSFLGWLGVDQGQFESAVARIAQLAEARGVSLLPVPASEPLLALGLAPSSPAPQPMHLFALSEGRAHLSASAALRSVAARGYFHTRSVAGRALARRSTFATAWSASDRSARNAIIASFADDTGATLERTGSVVALEVALPAGVSAAQAQSRYELVWTDAGLACALHGEFAGAPCELADFRLNASEVEVTPVAAGQAERLHRLSGYRLPAPASWDPSLSEEPTRGRVYALENDGGTRRVVAAIALDTRRAGSDATFVPDSEAFQNELVRLLAYRQPGEGCSACVPSSVCETTRCELGVCLREAVPDGSFCGASTCLEGVCESPGCGDGARSDGQQSVPFEACDDGNLFDGDGCSASCTVEQRALEPLVKEAFPGGPAPAIAIDGLGQALILYRKDALALGDDNAPIQAALFDAFGVVQGGPITIEAEVQRGSRADPTVVGLRDGGFAVLYASPNVEGEPGLAYRLVSPQGHVSNARAVEQSGALQLEGRIATLDDGFAVVFVERSAFSTRARLRMRRFDAEGHAFGSSSDVAAPQVSGAEQREPVLATSAGQLLVVWSEDEDGSSLGVRARRFGPLGTAVDDFPFVIASGEVGQPSAARLATDDYVVTFRQRGLVSTDIGARLVRRFGYPLEGSVSSGVIASELAEEQPVVAGARGEAFAIAYQADRSTKLYAPSLDVESVALASELLAEADQRDVSMLTGPTGIWITWSQRLAQGRALYALLLPFDAPEE